VPRRAEPVSRVAWPNVAEINGGNEIKPNAGIRDACINNKSDTTAGPAPNEHNPILALLSALSYGMRVAER